MSFEYIRKAYGINIKRGQRVKCKAWDGWTDGIITHCDNYVYIKPDNWPNRRLHFHPLDSDNWFPSPVEDEK